jgi:hypothetical protein
LVDEILASKIKPVTHDCQTFFDTIEEYLINSARLEIATGYVSVDSLIYLQTNIQRGKLENFQLIIGMHYFDGITRSQYQAAQSLNNFLIQQKLGTVRICTAFPFHGKMYIFSNATGAFASVVGSSNLANLAPAGANRQFEVDVHIRNLNLVEQLEALFRQLITTSSRPISEWNPSSFLETNTVLRNCIGVEKVPLIMHTRIWQGATNRKFEIPLKTELRSNLNAFFGKGRVDKRGFVRRRPWYEVELIVPKSITTQRGYPSKGTVITVFTDDMWSFQCKIQGDYGKNFRSLTDLKILGMWIKGRLEDASVLALGRPVTDSVLSAYGRKTLSLIGTNNPSIWLLDFSV